MTTKTAETLFERLERLRDELRLEASLGKAEAEDRWAELESKWRELKAHRRQIERAGVESATELKAAAELLVDELVEGYERIRKAL